MDKMDKTRLQANNLISNIRFWINIILWYVFTILSTIYSKKYLNLGFNAHSLTLVTLFYPAILKIGFLTKRHDFANIFKSAEHVRLGLFNIGTLLLTNIGMAETSVSLTYMVKASEPLFVLVLSYYILEESQTRQVLLTLVPICFGVTLIVYGASSFSLIGVSCAFAANIASASRNVFYKTQLKESSVSSPFSTFLNVGFVSFIFFIPIYIFQALINGSHSSFSILFDLNDEALKFLIYGSLFSFLYNLFSLQVLSNVEPISHSVINIMKRVFIVICSMLVLSTQITSIQWFGMVCADLGVFSYSIMKIKSIAVKVSISKEKKDCFKKCVVFTVLLILFLSCFVPSRLITYQKNKTFKIKNITHKIEKAAANQLPSFDSIENTGKIIIRENEIEKDFILANQETMNKRANLENQRVKCIEKIKDQIRSTLGPLIPKNRQTHLLDYPYHSNLGDSFIWFGEELILKELNITVFERLHILDKRIKSEEYLKSKITSNDTILLNGGGNFGDLYRHQNVLRENLFRFFAQNKFILFPQTIFYTNLTLIKIDNEIFSNISHLTLTVRSLQSFELAKKSFRKNTIVFVPDMSFMIGAIKPFHSAKVDVMILRRIDFESNFTLDEWNLILEKKLTNVNGRNVSYLIRDWIDYRNMSNETNVVDLPGIRVGLGNLVISQGRVVITDRLHASLMSLFIGRPHVMINDRFRKVQQTRESAFMGKPECSEENLRGYYVNNIEEAVDKALWLLKQDSIRS